MNKTLPILILGLGILVASRTCFGRESQYLRYEEFIGAVESGQVKQVQLGEYSGLSGIRIVGGKEEQFESFASRDTADNPLLLRLLKEKGVSISIAPHEKQTFFDSPAAHAVLGLVMFLLPLITFVFVLLVYRHVKSLSKSKPGDRSR